MEQQMLELLGFASILAPIVSGVVQILKKKTTADGIMLPILAIFTGIIVGGAWALSFESSLLVAYLWAGFFAGMASIGIFEVARRV